MIIAQSGQDNAQWQLVWNSPTPLDDIQASPNDPVILSLCRKNGRVIMECPLIKPIYHVEVR